MTRRHGGAAEWPALNAVEATTGVTPSNGEQQLVKAFRILPAGERLRFVLRHTEVWDAKCAPRRQRPHLVLVEKWNTA